MTVYHVTKTSDGDRTDLIMKLADRFSPLVAFFPSQKVMATHRELENLRRSSKTSRSSKLWGFQVPATLILQSPLWFVGNDGTPNV